VMNDLPILSVDEVIERIDAVGIAELRELAGELLAPGRLSVAGVGPQQAVFDAAIEGLEGPLAGIVKAGGEHGGANGQASIAGSQR